MAALTVDLAMSVITDWLRERRTPICWLVGPAGSGKTVAAQTLLASTQRTRVLPLSAASPDRCLQQVFDTRTTAGVFARLTTECTRLLALDALDTVQHRDEERAGQVFDLRLRHLLSSAARGRWPALSTVVTSRLRPPRELPGEAVTVLEFAAPRQPADEAPSLKRGDAAVLEVLASSRRASSGWLLGLLTGRHGRRPSLSTHAAVHKALDRALSAGLVRRIASRKSGEWFQMSDSMRSHFLSPARSVAVHALVADGLESDDLPRYVELAAEDDPELLHDLLERAMVHRLEAGDIQGAIRCYWQRLGNFSLLESRNALHLGARACGTLNDGRPPHQLSPALKESGDPALSVINDWGVHASCLGDAALASEAALAAYALCTEDLNPWDHSMLARHAAESLLLRGRLLEAMHHAERAEEHARAGLRKSGGLPTKEIMSAYEHALYAMMRIVAVSGDAAGMAQLLGELVELHSHARKMLAEFNRFSVLPLPGPSGEPDAEELLNGRPAALAALAAGRPGDAVRILTSQLASWPQEQWASRQALEVRTLLLRAQLADARHPEAREPLVQLRKLADTHDDTAARCELASLAAVLALFEGNAEAALALTDEFLVLASNCELTLQRNDLVQVRSKSLLALGRVEAARASAEELQEVAAAPVARPPRLWRQPAKASEAPREAGPERRVQLHEAALAVIEDYNTRGLPFALYFRTYDFSASHGPMEFGPRLIENVLHEALPPGARVLTIQAHDDVLGYSGTGSRFDRSASALLLGDEHWQDIAASLIPFADLIVSEIYMLSEGVRFELDTAYRMNRWDRTVLLLPPMKSYLPVLDSDPLIQMFPRCIWMDSFHTEALADSPVIKDLLTRMAEIAALPEEDRRRFIAPAARDEAYPVDLLPLALHYRNDVAWSSQWQDEDDRVRYYGFWKLFRAASILGARMMKGDDSFDNRSALSSAYVQMSAIQLDHERDGDKVVLIGDLTFAEQCARSALALIRESDGEGLVAHYFRGQAEKQLHGVLEVRGAVKAHPDRFVMRPRYGPFPVHAAPRS
jgi:hypothetical protein